jgi:hypothetical protein
MRRDRRRSDPPPIRPRDEPPPSRWESVGVWLEFGGFSLLVASGMISAAWGAIRYVIGII